jgi:prepilin-type N-terminal cleavage/methylation domain-containing protein
MKKKALALGKPGFTLLEIIIAMTIFCVLFVVIISLYARMTRLKYNIQARQSLIENSYNAMEKINLLLKDYTIDYEEYFNRQEIGCNGNNSGSNFTRNVGTS